MLTCTSLLRVLIVNVMTHFLPIRICPCIHVYFTRSGLKTQFNALTSGTAWGCVVLVCVAASVGKMGGCSIAARLSGHTWRESFVIGAFMNCKGLIELIVL